MPESSKYLREDLVLDNGHLLVQVLKRSGISAENSPQGAWDHIADEMVLGTCRKRAAYFPCNDSIVQGYSQEQRTWKTVDTLHCRLSNNWNSFSHHHFCQSAQYLRSSGEHMWRNLKLIKMGQENQVLMGQSIVLGEIKAETPLQNENYSNHQILWQQYMERIESLSPENKVSRFCMEAGFMRVVEVEQ